MFKRANTNAGLAAANARGVKLGRRVTIDPHRGDINRLRAQGLTGRAIKTVQDFDKAADIRFVERGIHFVQHAERAGLHHVDGEKRETAVIVRSPPERSEML